MPAAAVASLTPSIGGMSGNWAGASGEMVVGKGGSVMPGPVPGIHVLATGIKDVDGRNKPGYEAETAAWNLDRLLLRVGGRLVETLDLGTLAELRHEVGLRLTG